MTIKLWNWEMGWKCQQTFEGHSHYVGHPVVYWAYSDYLMKYILNGRGRGAEQGTRDKI